MKTTTILLLIAIAFAATTSCMKERDTTLTNTINVNLSSGQSYSYNVPRAGDADDVMQVTEQPAHGTASLSPVAGSTASSFTYAPSSGYSGTDEVQVSNVENHQGHGGGQCGGHHGETVKYVFKITINGGETTAMKVHHPFRAIGNPVF